MNQPIQISEAESQVMEVLWRGSPRTAEDVVAALSDQQQWQEATIKTLLNRLLKKGAVRAEKDGRRFLYSPLLTRDQWVVAESSSIPPMIRTGHSPHAPTYECAMNASMSSLWASRESNGMEIIAMQSRRLNSATSRLKDWRRKSRRL